MSFIPIENLSCLNNKTYEYKIIIDYQFLLTIWYFIFLVSIIPW